MPQEMQQKPTHRHLAPDPRPIRVTESQTGVAWMMSVPVKVSDLMNVPDLGRRPTRVMAFPTEVVFNPLDGPQQNGLTPAAMG